MAGGPGALSKARSLSWTRPSRMSCQTPESAAPNASAADQNSKSVSGNLNFIITAESSAPVEPSPLKEE
jgi:hypothetical protein